MNMNQCQTAETLLSHGRSRESVKTSQTASTSFTLARCHRQSASNAQQDVHIWEVRLATQLYCCADCRRSFCRRSALTMALPTKKLGLQKFRMRKVVDVHSWCSGYVDCCFLADNVRYKSQQSRCRDWHPCTHTSVYHTTLFSCHASRLLTHLYFFLFL